MCLCKQTQVQGCIHKHSREGREKQREIDACCF
uniref:Uncharacterized protein n=1 Tax=Rhizophora mucronata TaxID=61149 RepID=A0A2P2N9G6_RHIMU